MGALDPALAHQPRTEGPGTAREGTAAEDRHGRRRPPPADLAGAADQRAAPPDRRHEGLRATPRQGP